MTLLGSSSPSSCSDREGRMLKRASLRLQTVEWEKRLTVFFRPSRVSPSLIAPEHAAAFELQVVGVDKAGSRERRTLPCDHRINISQMRLSRAPNQKPAHRSSHADHHGSPSAVDWPRSASSSMRLPLSFTSSSASGRRET